MDESEAAPSIPLVLDEELDAMKIKISQIKSDIQREKVRGQAGGEPGWLCSSSSDFLCLDSPSESCSLPLAGSGRHFATYSYRLQLQLILIHSAIRLCTFLYQRLFR